jgi:hypothetical protein
MVLYSWLYITFYLHITHFDNDDILLRMKFVFQVFFSIIENYYFHYYCTIHENFDFDFDCSAYFSSTCILFLALIEFKNKTKTNETKRTSQNPKQGSHLICFYFLV